MLRNLYVLRPLLALLTLLALLPSNQLIPPATVAAATTPVSLPRKCGTGLPSGTADAACCMFGYVFADGQPVADAVVEVFNPRTNGTLTVATMSSPGNDAPYYSVSLSDAPLSAIPGDSLTIKARYSSHFATVQHTVLQDGQQVDLVIQKQAAPDFTFERQFRDQMAPGQFGLFKSGVAVDGAGVVYVADYANARIQAFSHDGTFVRQWGTYGAAPGQMVTPAGVTVDHLGFVYVADYGAQLIHKFTSAGTWIATWGDFNGGSNQLSFPTDLTVDADGYIYFVEQGGQGTPRSISRIQKRTRDGVIVKVWGTVGSAAGQLNGPEGIAIGPDGLLYVADTGNNRVQVFTRDGVFVRQWDGTATAAGALNQPQRLAVDSNGRVLVSDSDNHRIVVFSAIGAFIQQWDGQNTGDPIALHPQGIALDANNVVYVVDNNNSRIQVFSGTGTFSHHWGSLGYPDNYFEAPAGITRDNAGNVYVVDNAKALVRKYDSTGTHIADLGQPYDIGPTGLLYPYGIATNGTSELYIVDKDNARIQVFSLTGVPLRRWGSPGAGNGQFNQPYGVAVDSSGNVYVADAGNNRVQKFSAQGTFLWSQGGSGASQFNFPVGVAISLDGSTVYATDTNNDRVQRLSTSNGAILGQFGSSGGNPGQFNTPAGITVAPDSALVIAEAGNYRIQRLAPDGTSLNIYGFPGAGQGELDLPTTVLAKPDGDIIVGERLLSRVQILHPLAFTRPIATIVAAGPLTVQPSTAVTLHGIGSDSSAGGTIVGYTWTLDGAAFASTTDATLPTNGLSVGSHTIGFQVQNDKAQLSDLQTVTLSVVAGVVQDNSEPVPHTWTFMLYLAGDNPNTSPYLNADSSLGALYRLLHTTPNTRVTVVALFDGDKPGGGDTFRYLLRPGAAPVIESQPEADMGNPQTLVDFVNWGRQQAPADAYYLAIADHGSALDGTSWDYTSDPDRKERLTPGKLQQALSQITDGGVRPLDVLHLDACLLGSVEIAYQLRGQARYLVDSENLAWSAFAYDQYLTLVSDGTTPRQLATSIAGRYSQLVSAHHLPFTIAAIDLRQVPPLAQALNTLSGELLRYAQSSEEHRNTLASVRQPAQLLDSDGDNQLTAADEYIDLGDWLTKIAAIPDTAVQQAAATALTALHTAVIAEHHAAIGALHLDSISGLSIYYPPHPGARTYATYRTSLSFADATLWDELLQAGLAALAPIPDSGPHPVAPQVFSAKTQIFVPFVRK